MYVAAPKMSTNVDKNGVERRRRMGAVVAIEGQPLTARRLISLTFKVIGKILRVIFWVVLIMTIITAGGGGVWMLGKVETASGTAPRWKVGQVWIQNFMDMPRFCSSAYGMGVLTLPIGIVGEPIEAVINDDKLILYEY